MPVRYADEAVGPYTLHRRPVAKHGNMAPGQNAEGYGRKITSDIVLKFTDDPREHRVYITQFSNAGTCWIKYRGETLCLRTHFQAEVRDD